MAEPIGALRALLSASSAAFESDMKKARDAVRKNTNDMRSAFDKLEATANKSIKKMLTYRGALSALAGATGFYLATKNAIKFADAIGESADTAGLAVEEYQELRYAAQQNSVGLEEFGSGMEKFTKKLGDAIRGSKEARKSFSNFGIDEATLKSKTAGEVIGLLADKFKGIKDPAARASAAMEFFGKSGQRFSNFLALGSKEIDVFRAKARALGIVLSEDTVRRAQAASDELDTMGEVIKIGLTNAALEFIPVMRELAAIVSSPAFVSSMRDLAALSAALLKTFSVLAPTIAGAAVSLVTFKLAMMATKNDKAALIALLTGTAAAAYVAYRQYGPMNKAQKESGETAKGAAAGQQQFNASLDEEAAKLGKNTKLLQERVAHLQKMVEVYRDAPDIADSMNEVMQVEEAAAQQGIDLSTKQGKAWATAERQRLILERGLQDQKRVLDEIRTPTESYNAELDRLNQLFAAGYLTQEQYNAALEKAKDRFSAAQAQVKGLAGAGDEMAGAFESAFEKMITGSESFSDSLKGLARELINIALKKAILEPAGNALSSVLGSVLGKVGSSFSFGGGKAVGGPVFPGREYIVGENGPERVRFGAAGHVTPNSELMGGNTYVIDARGADQGAVLRIEAALLRLAGPGVTEKRVRDAQQRGKI